VCRIVAGAANACVFTAGALIGGVGTCVACKAGKCQMATAQTSCVGWHRVAGSGGGGQGAVVRTYGGAGRGGPGGGGNGTWREAVPAGVDQAAAALARADQRVAQRSRQRRRQDDGRAVGRDGMAGTTTQLLLFLFVFSAGTLTG